VGRYTHMMGHPTCRPTIELHGGKQGMFALAAWKDFDGPGVVRMLDLPTTPPPLTPRLLELTKLGGRCVLLGGCFD
jgi:hypothetical protein